MPTIYKGRADHEAKVREEWYWKHRDEQLAKAKAKRSTPEYKQKSHEYYQRHKKELNDRQKERRIERKVRDFSDWKGEKPPELRAGKGENYNVWRSKMLDKRDKQCLICGCTEPSNRNGDKLTTLVLHHLDYKFPDLTTTLCYSCHRLVHIGKIKLGFNATECPTCKHNVYKVYRVN